MGTNPSVVDNLYSSDTHFKFKTININVIFYRGNRAPPRSEPNKIFSGISNPQLSKCRLYYMMFFKSRNNRDIYCKEVHMKT